MTTDDQIQLFVLKCAAVKLAVDEINPGAAVARTPPSDAEATIKSSVAQFSADVRENAVRMAEYYKLFYMLENDIRKLIDETLAEAYGPDWWDVHAPNTAKDECKANQQREQEAGFTARSDSELDYVTFGHLGDIIRHNWTLFGGILSNQKAMGRVMYSLNNLRGPIAHCGILAEDEVDRLKLTVKDWFRLLEGPK
ncbi:Swt1 family HEPN domain-containing protein [Methylovirgula sp. 4M-Z18]|uniref:Swt1 family HEPN domain-containing protein n=1 Tax=Methylovirgula sp. 4M-Z18 TaxID=2293567 RepID=UPI000E2E66F4|nr:Swt1 family HEPN domain-containing protein [Methylovirgula sp. 4M-Z18]RFB78379.1 hypothetical protein DYH55_16685 [Methylovirgula sp. 4M-Z18]